MACSNECLGGCYNPQQKMKLADTQDECFACKHYLSPMSADKFSANGYHGCWPNCSKGFVTVKYFK